MTLLLCSVGCSMALPRVKPPAIDAAAAAHGALAAFDANHDGAISKAEAQAACSGIADNWDRYDQDGDGSVTQAELESRFQKWTSGDTGLMNLRAEVTFRGKPLPDATVQLTPYEFLGPNVLPAEGVTDRYGYAFLAIPKDRLPASQQATHGMQVGLYRASITHPEQQLPAKFNAETTLAVDLSPNEANTGVRFALK